MRSKLATLAVVATVIASISSAPARATGTDVVDTAVATGQFKTLAAALDGAGLPPAPEEVLHLVVRGTT